MFPLPSLFGLKTTAIGVLVALVVGFGSGVWVRDAFCDAAAAKLQVQVLKKQIEAREAAANNDQRAYEKAQETIEELKRKADDAEHQASPGECLPAGDTDRVRKLWPK